MMLITEDYRALNRRMHEEKPHYGRGARLTAHVTKLWRLNQFTTILDYGCGKGELKRSLPDLPIEEYDPAIPGKDCEAEPADLVLCSDVLEHVEPECLDEVLKDLRRVTKRVAVLLVALTPASKHLADGRNAHLILESKSWWEAKLARHFAILAESPAGDDACWYLA